MLLSQRKQTGNKSSVPERLSRVLLFHQSLSHNSKKADVRLNSSPQGRMASYLSVVSVSWGCVRRGRWIGFDSSALHVWNKLVRDFRQDIFGQPRHAQDMVTRPIHVVSEWHKLQRPWKTHFVSYLQPLVLLLVMAVAVRDWAEFKLDIINEDNPACLDIILTNVPCTKEKCLWENPEVHLGSTLIMAVLVMGYGSWISYLKLNCKGHLFNLNR